MTKSRDLADNAQNTKPKVVDAKGDLLVGTGSDAADRLAVSDNGSTIVADSAATTGLRWQADFSVGRNKIINGDFAINQRAFTSVTTNATYCFDRFRLTKVGSDGTTTITPQTFTPGAAPVAGYESTNFLRIDTTGQTDVNTASIVNQPIEDVRTFAGQTVTVSFWAKAATGTPKVAIELEQAFGSGGSSAVLNYAGQVTISTSWARYTGTVAIPSISGKTIGTASRVNLNLWTSAGSTYNSRTGSMGIQTATIDFWGVQVEAGSVATAFQTATGTLQGELAACQRYYWRSTGPNAYSLVGSGFARATTEAWFDIPFPVTMRTSPTSADFSNLMAYDATTIFAISTIGVSTGNSGVNHAQVIASSMTGLTANRPYFLQLNNNANGFIGFNAEL